MKTIIHSNSDQLRASLLTAATKDIRYYLCGVCIEASPTYTRLISTDGHRASIQGYKVENTIEREIQFIVPFDTLKMLKPKDTFVKFESEDYINWTMTTKNFSVNFTIVDGKFPDWRRILPKDSEQLGTPAQFNVEYLADFGKASKILGFGSDFQNVFIKHNGENTTEVRLNSSSYLGIIMPIRAEMIKKDIPELDSDLITPLFTESAELKVA